MTASSARSAGLGGFAVIAAIAAACGAKGPPLAPLRPIPVAVANWSIEREGAAIKLRVPIPDANIDGSQPPAVDRVEIYALTLAADATPPGVAALVVSENLIGTIEVRPPDPPKAGAPPDPRPAAGDVATFTDLTPPTATASIRYFAAVAAASRRKSHTGILPVSLAEGPAAPSNLKVDFTEQKLTVTWTAETGVRYVVYATDEQGSSAKRLNVEPQEAATYDENVEFGKSRCFAVRSAHVKDAVTIIGVPTASSCVTPRDRFPPPVPSGLQAVPADPGVVELLWSAVQSADLAGYVVLRGDGANGTLQPLTPDVVTTTTYRDATASPGSTYVYAVVAVDKAGNRSEISNKSVATARTPAASSRYER